MGGISNVIATVIITSFIVFPIGWLVGAKSAIDYANVTLRNKRR